MPFTPKVRMGTTGSPSPSPVGSGRTCLPGIHFHEKPTEVPRPYMGLCQPAPTHPVTPPVPCHPHTLTPQCGLLPTHPPTPQVSCHPPTPQVPCHPLPPKCRATHPHPKCRATHPPPLTWDTVATLNEHSSGAMYPGVPRARHSAWPDPSTFNASPMSDTLDTSSRPSVDSRTLPGWEGVGGCRWVQEGAGGCKRV
jgi:hypothetical protein